MPTDEAKLTELLDRFVTDLDGTGHAEPNSSQSSPTGTWTIDPADSTVSVAWRKLRRWTITGQLHGMGVIHLDELPPVGVIRFEQPSGLPILTMALDPASVETGDTGLDAMLRGPDHFDALRHRWWTLRSQSLEVLPTGTWRVMATLTARGTAALVELRFAVIPEASGPDALVLRGRGVLDRRAFGIGKQAWSFDSQIQLELALRARRVVTDSRAQGQEQEKVTCTTSMLS
jgi:polyisoprenoid-binding protein YceI